MKGKQIFINYGVDSCRITESTKRREILTKKFFFDCKCEECSREVPESVREALPDEVREDCGDENLISFQVAQEVRRLIVEGRKLVENGELLKARELLQSAQKKCLYPESYVERDSPFFKTMEFAFTCDLLAQIAVMRGREGEAARLLIQGLPALQSIYGDTSIEVGNEMFKVCQLLFNARDKDRAEKMIKKTRAIFVTAFGPNHDDVRELDEMLRHLRF